MAIQKGSIILDGQIGDLSFYQSQGKPQVRRRSGVGKDRVKKDPRYARTRENNAEFGRASSAAKQIRFAVKLALGERRQLFEDPSLANRLTTRLSAVIAADAEHGRGARVVQSEGIRLLTGFSFNAVAALKDVLLIPPHYTYRREIGSLEVTLPALYPQVAIVAPKGSEYCSFHVAAVLFNADDELLPVVAQANELLPLGFQVLPAQTFRLELPAGTSDPVICCFGMSFFGNLGGYPIPILEQSRNVFEVIGVDIDCTSHADTQ